MMGGGVFDAGVLQLRDDQIRDNTERAVSAGGTLQGGGIWAGPLAPFPEQLAVEGSSITHNGLEAGTAGTLLQGGGLFASIPATLNDNSITHNSPDNRSGAPCSKLNAVLPP